MPNTRLKQREAKAIIAAVMQEKLAGQAYHAEMTSRLARDLSDEIKNRLKAELDLPRYKWVVQVAIGQQKGQGVKMAGRCLWDSDTDSYATDLYINETLFCVASAFGVYLY